MDVAFPLVRGISIPETTLAISRDYTSGMTNPPPFRRRRAYFRVAAIAVGLGVLALAEGALRLVGVERYYAPAAPLVGFSDIQPLFVKDEDTQTFQIPPSRHAFFQPESFAADKAVDGYRIFCLGGSTVQGRPYSIETSFTTWLELNLKAADPDRHWEVVNCGGVSYASYRLVPIMREVLQYEPDLFIIYTGHNEFLEERSYADIKRRARWIRNLQDQIFQTRIAGLIRTCLPAAPPQPAIDLPAEVDALLDYEGGLAHYHRDETWRNGVIYEYEQNLQKMTEIARDAAVPLLLLNPVSNVRDTPPFKVELPADFSDEQRARLAAAWQTAISASWDALDESWRPRRQYFRSIRNTRRRCFCSPRSRKHEATTTRQGIRISTPRTPTFARCECWSPCTMR